MKTVTSQLQMANESVVSHQTHHYLSILVNFNVYREKLYQNVSLPIMYTMFPSLTAAWKRPNPPRDAFNLFAEADRRPRFEHPH